MAVLDLRIWPDPILLSKTKPIEQFDQSVLLLLRDLFDSMYHHQGIGMAANQIGYDRQALVIDLDPHRRRVTDPELDAQLQQDGFHGPLALFNPKITSSKGSIDWEEGCLSFPEITVHTQRYKTVTVMAQDAQGQPFSLVAHNLFAVAIQHEMDHLAGLVMIEAKGVSKLERELVQKEMRRKAQT